ncbi:MAG: hypothetical protein V3V08_08595 [Nannocystaceae bacterium]
MPPFLILTRRHIRATTAALVLLPLLHSCKPGPEREPEEEKPGAETVVRTPPGSDAGTASRGVFGWLDPDAVGAIFGRRDASLDLAALATIYGLPPRAADLLTADEAVGSALATALDQSGAGTNLWADQWIAFSSPMSTAIHVLRALADPRHDLSTTFTTPEYVRSEVEGFPAFSPRGAFPWKIVRLDPQVVAFVRRSEMGGGLRRFTAGRDLPASPVGQWLRRDAKDPDVLHTLYAAGPMLHLDLSGDVAQAHFMLRRWQTRGLDGSVRLDIIGGDATTGARELTERSGAFESERVRALMRKAAFSPEAARIVGRLQLSARDVPRAPRYDP